jgi:multidrug efflux pump subunit AcrA (membrane-fusion protein)
VTFAGLQKVIMVQDGVAVERPVTTGETHGVQVEILSGLAAGDSVVHEPGSLAQGQPVRVRTGPAGGQR